MAGLGAPRERQLVGEDGSGEEDFLYHLHRGADLLAAGKHVEARDELERAFHLRPRDSKAQNLLGLSYFKLGLLDRAIGIYERLVEDNPGDSTLRVNLGLVFLKAGRTPESIAQFEAATDLVPDHPKALNYLGLAYAQVQAHGKAKDAFSRAGNSSMARKMDSLGQAPARTRETQRSANTDLTETLSEVEGVPTLASGAPLFGRSGKAPLGLGELARFSVYDPPDGLPFQVDATGVTLRVAGELRTRLDGLLWVRGELQRHGEMKRFRGRSTERPFGEGSDRVFRLTGHGQVVLASQGLVFTPVALADEAAYLVEDALFAFEDTLGFENGRVPSRTPPDLALVHLRGQGKALLRSEGPLRSVEVRAGEPVQLPVDRLVGWMGQLTPTLLLPEATEAAALGERSFGRWLRLEGEGWALWAQPTPRS